MYINKKNGASYGFQAPEIKEHAGKHFDFPLAVPHIRYITDEEIDAGEAVVDISSRETYIVGVGDGLTIEAGSLFGKTSEDIDQMTDDEILGFLESKTGSRVTALVGNGCEVTIFGMSITAPETNNAVYEFVYIDGCFYLLNPVQELPNVQTT